MHKGEWDVSNSLAPDWLSGPFHLMSCKHYDKQKNQFSILLIYERSENVNSKKQLFAAESNGKIFTVFQLLIVRFYLFPNYLNSVERFCMIGSSK